MSDHDYKDSNYIGIDIGTSTAQACAGRAGVQTIALKAKVGRHYVENYPCAIAEIAPGEFLFGGEALRAAHQPGVHLHRHFKAYLSRDCPLEGPYDQEQAAQLFEAFAVHLICLYGERIIQMVLRTGRTRVDLCLTLPAGWRVDPETDDLFCALIARIVEQALTDLGHEVTIVPRMVEEPVAALFGLRVDHVIAPGNTLILDVGAGTFDAAVCSSNAESELDAWCVELCRSSGLAGAATLEAFIDALDELGAFSPAISDDIRHDPRFNLQMEQIFEEVSGALDDEHASWLEVGATHFEVRFSIRKALTQLRSHEVLAGQRAFLKTLLPEFRRRIGKTILGFDSVFLVGGLAQFEPFADLVREVFPEVVVVQHDVQRRVAMGAAEYARLGGRQIGERVPEFILAEQMLRTRDSTSVMVPVVAAGTRVSSDRDNPFEAEGFYQGGGGFFSLGSTKLKMVLAWTHSEDPADNVKTIFADTITMPVRMAKGDMLRTLLWFDEMLRIRFAVVHVPSGERWTHPTALSWGM